MNFDDVRQPSLHMGSGKGVDQCCSWGDYFYLELLARLRQIWYPYW